MARVCGSLFEGEYPLGDVGKVGLQPGQVVGGDGYGGRGDVAAGDALPEQPLVQVCGVAAFGVVQLAHPAVGGGEEGAGPAGVVGDPEPVHAG